MRILGGEIMYRVWYSTESLADYIIDHTKLKQKTVSKKKIYESDTSNPSNFYTVPDHIRKILYLDAPDLIIELDNEPLLSLEISAEAGTGHNVFQRFARIAAAVENDVPAFYIYPEGKIISRKKFRSSKWDELNPLIFKALDEMMSLYQIPALLYYFPTDNIKASTPDPSSAPHFKTAGLIYDSNIKYSACPDASAQSMQNMFAAINRIIDDTDSLGVKAARLSLLQRHEFRNQRSFMQHEFYNKSLGKLSEGMSPLSAVKIVDTKYLLHYLSKYETRDYHLGELLRGREQTCLYQIDAKFRGDPYPGCLAAIDYLKCRNGNTFEDRDLNLVMVWGEVQIDDITGTLRIIDNHGSSISDFFDDVKSCGKKNLLTRDYSQLSGYEIPRYFMQVRYGSTYSKVKHIRVYSYFADAILFPDGSLWKDA